MHHFPSYYRNETYSYFGSEAVHHSHIISTCGIDMSIDGQKGRDRPVAEVDVERFPQLPPSIRASSIYLDTPVAEPNIHLWENKMQC